MIFYILRHGVTEWNIERRVQGCADIPLAEDGVRLARLTGDALKGVPFDICFTSPLSRARRTAELVLGSRADKIPVIPDDRIREINFGILEGTALVDTEGNRNGQIEIFLRDPSRFVRPEDGEDISDIICRTREFWEEKTADPDLADKTVLVATHGCASRALLQNVQYDPKNFWRGSVPPNCGITIVEVREGCARILEEDRVFASL